MSDVSERPFEATPARIRRARREGDVARSSELAANVSFAAGALTLAAIVPVLGASAARALIGAAHDEPAAAADVLALALLPVAAAAIAGMLGGLAQNGGVHVVSLAPQVARLNPVDGIKRILSRDTLARSLRAVLAFGCASAAMAPFVALQAVSSMQSTAIGAVAAQTWRAARQIALAACIVGCGFAIAEYAAARGTWLRKLRMSFEERRRETKEEEGDAGTRHRRRSLHRALLRGGMHRLQAATFVIANPQHVAVALEYRPPRVTVPRVLLRACDLAAIHVRTAAERYGIPIVENAVLARALYRDGRAGEAIPTAHYVAVAEVVAALLRTRRIAAS